MTGKDLRIVFMGTPDFAVASLAALIEKGYMVVGVVTAPDKPAGRGQKLQQSAVKAYALAQHLPVLQPEKLKEEGFLAELKSLKADLQIIVAFRMPARSGMEDACYGHFQPAWFSFTKISRSCTAQLGNHEWRSGEWRHHFPVETGDRYRQHPFLGESSYFA